LKDYELVVIFRPILEEQPLEQEIEKVSGVIKDQNGKILEVDRWGKKPLAFEMQRERNGVYVLIRFRGEASSLSELNRLLRLNEQVLRHRVLLAGKAGTGVEGVLQAEEEEPVEEDELQE
jgi:small subunit ribosomal protein S6